MFRKILLGEIGINSCDSNSINDDMSEDNRSLLHKSKENIKKKKLKVVVKKKRKKNAKKRKKIPSPDLMLRSSKDIKGPAKKIIDLANSESLREETPPLMDKNNSIENDADYLMGSFTDSKERLSKADKMSKDDNQIHVFEELGEQDQE
uniref:Uncharacterized protein n=1 Tax=Euplotes crassus TaxID=5936 RepID=A0A7S3KJ02_EUPCR|mmetsp:Transcript_30273/g.29773  ORF Transcript_30273/g.29773 Transcript_30273/m.29773 type:complete len:149 (+) Transcript_30273:206-652(+)|eukprot:CAMPEP_0196999012 /NCGR_PEP_ID=MMETSP1380-20130617/4284_1 /TAXON_ID=5936 /ORGANISM="Euplotes crassus, Strain CT5" /LENGTH=148 /DNA_ID=CAMNT_0042415797 /DNA_START=206 /DNA_END=652 /DNA_ORIENTATION=-